MLADVLAGLSARSSGRSSASSEAEDPSGGAASRLRRRRLVRPCGDRNQRARRVGQRPRQSAQPLERGADQVALRSGFRRRRRPWRLSRFDRREERRRRAVARALLGGLMIVVGVAMFLKRKADGDPGIRLTRESASVLLAAASRRGLRRRPSQRLLRHRRRLPDRAGPDARHRHVAALCYRHLARGGDRLRGGDRRELCLSGLIDWRIALLFIVGGWIGGLGGDRSRPPSRRAERRARRNPRRTRHHGRHPHGGAGHGAPAAVIATMARQYWRATIIFLISAIAFAGLRPFGQAFEQFMIVWQR